MKRALAVLFVLISTTVYGSPWRSSGPAGGSVKMIVAAPSNRRVLYVISTGGVFRSGDAGATWSNITGRLTAPNLLAVDPTDENVAYVATRYLLYKTSDGGTSWRQLAGGLPADSGGLTSVLIDPRDPRVVYVSSACIPTEAGALLDGAGVFKSTDRGLTFNLSINGMQGFQPCVTGMALDPLHPDTIYSQPYFVRSDDGARTWTRAASILPGGNVVADPRNDRVRYAAGFGGLMTSVDGGVHWSLISPKLLASDPTVAPSTAFVDAATLAIDPALSRLFLGGRQGLSRSGNGGQTALRIDGPVPASINSVVFDPVDGALTVGTNESVQRSAFPWTDWITLPTGDKSTPMAEVVASQHDPATAYARSSRLHVTHDYGISWSPLPADPLPVDSNGVPLFIFGFDVGVDETVYATVYDQHDGVAHLFKLPAGSTHWIELNPPGVLLSVVADPHVAGTIYGVENSDVLVRTRDGGATWEILHLPSGAYARGLAIDPANSEIIHAITSAGLMKSSDGGRSWKSTFPQAGVLSHLTISPADPNTLYLDAYASNRIYRSVDRGETWSVSGVPPSIFVGALVADPIDPETVYLADVDLGIFRSGDGGATWKAINDGLPSTFIFAIVVSADGAVLHTPLNGMWELPLRGRRRPAR